MDKLFMTEALKLAKLAAEKGEIPVGAVVVRDGEIVGRGYNLRENKKKRRGACGDPRYRGSVQCCWRLAA